MRRIAYIFVVALLVFFQHATRAQPEIEMDTTVIKGNKELPKILYIVPWQDMKQSRNQQHTLVLHSLFGDIFEPVVPAAGNTPAHPADTD